eukprot:TRINITY_DN14742_c0_g1_i2.p1 TRINITY_DN14742_c0_g1~~TRINITY_DN14742_c0_g1_i2.p1  ORF type:complete len:5339 (+),score=1177.74 TRINITY_DN14742_c0_g1_i2:914-16018(+)
MAVSPTSCRTGCGDASTAVFSSLGYCRSEAVVLRAAAGSQIVAAETPVIVVTPGCLDCALCACAGGGGSLRVVAQPSDGLAGQVLGGISVEARDAGGNLVLASTARIVLRARIGQTRVLSGKLEKRLVSAAVTFDDVKVRSAGELLLEAAVVGGSVTVQVSPILVKQQTVRVLSAPRVVTAGVSFTVRLHVTTELDPTTTLKTASGQVRLWCSWCGDSAPEPRALAAGVATFSNLSITAAGEATFYGHADGAVVSAGIPVAVAVQEAAPASVEVVPPALATACEAFSVRTTVRDAFGNPVRRWPANVTLYAVPCRSDGDDECLSPDSNDQAEAFVSQLAQSSTRDPLPSTLWLGSTPANASYSSVTYTVGGLQLREVRESVRVAAMLSVSPAVYGLSLLPTSMVVRHGQPHHAEVAVIRCGKEVSTIVSDAEFDVRVTVSDRCGNAVTTGLPVSSVYVSSGAGSFHSASRLATAVLGTAVHKGLKLSVAGTVRISAQVGKLPPARSQAVTVQPGRAAKLAVTCPPRSGTVAGEAFSVRVAVRDEAGNAVTAASQAAARSNACGVVKTAAPAAVASIRADPGSVRGTLTANVSTGFATASDLSIVQALDTTITVSVTGVPSVSCAMEVVPGLPVGLVLLSQPTRASIDVGFSKVTFAAVDQHGNRIPKPGLPAVLRASGGATKPLTAPKGSGAKLSVMAVDGIYTFQAFTYPKDEAITLTAALCESSIAAETASIAVQRDVAVFVSPTSAVTVAAAAAFSASVQVQIRQAGGSPQIQTAFTSDLALNLVHPNGTTEEGWVNPAGSEGSSHTFSALSISRVGEYTLEVTGQGLAAGVSPLVTVTPAAPQTMALAVSLSDGVLTAGVGTGDSLPTRVQAEREQMSAAVAGKPLTITAALLDASQNVGVCSAMPTASRLATACSPADASCLCTWSLRFFTYVVDPADPTRCLQSADTTECSDCPAWGGSVGGCKRVYRSFSYLGDEYPPPLAATVEVARTTGSGTFTNVVYTTAERVWVVVSDTSYSSGWETEPAAVVFAPAAASAVAVTAGPQTACSDEKAFGVVRAEIRDAYGNVATASNATVSVSPGELAGGTLRGTLEAASAGGMTTFGDLTYDKAETLELILAADGIAGTAVHSVRVRGCTPHRVVVSERPAVLVSAEPAFFTVSIVDVNNNVVRTAAASKYVATVSVSEGTGYFYEGVLEAPFEGGRANLTDLKFDQAGPIKLVFSALPDGPLAARTGTIQVLPGRPAAVTILSHTNPLAWDVAAELTAAVRDVRGNTVLNDSRVLELEVACEGTGCGMNEAAGSLRVEVQDGLAVFTPFILPAGHASQAQVTGVALTVADPSGELEPGVSAAVPVATNVVSIASVERNVTSGTALSLPVQIRTAAGAAVAVSVSVSFELVSLASRTVSAALSRTAVATAACTTSAAGACTGTLATSKTGGYLVRATAAGYKGDSIWLSVTPAAPSTCYIDFAPAVVVAGEAFSVDVGLKDGAGNTPVCGYERGTRRAAPRLSTGTAASADACSASCVAAPVCMAWTFWTSNSSCGLMLQPGSVTEAPGAVSGLRGARSCSLQEPAVSIGPEWVAGAGAGYQMTTGGVARLESLSYAHATQLPLSVSCLSDTLTVYVTVIAGAAAQLVFTAQPVSITAGAAFEVTVEVRDHLSNVVPSFADTVTLSAPRGTGLTGTVRRSPTAGAVRFGGIRYETAGVVTLAAITPSRLRAVSQPITVSAAAAARASALLPPSIQAGVPFYVVVQVTDEYGNPAAVEATAALVQTSGPSRNRKGEPSTNIATVCGSCDFAGATANISGVVITAAGTYGINATAGALPPVALGPVAVGHGTSAWRLRLTNALPISASVDQPMAPLDVESVDRYDNVVPLDSVGVSISVNRGGLLDGQVDAELVGGRARLAPVAWYRDPECSRSPRREPPEGLTDAECTEPVQPTSLLVSSDLDNVSAASAGLAFSVDVLRLSVAATLPAGSSATVSVFLTDASGAAVATPRTVTLTVAGYVGDAADPVVSVPEAGLTASTSSGTATFTFPMVSLGRYTLSASAFQASTGVGDVTVVAGAASRFVVDSPAEVAAGETFSVDVSVVDAYSNAVALADAAFSLSVSAGGSDSDLVPAANRLVALPVNATSTLFSVSYSKPAVLSLTVTATGPSGWSAAAQQTGPLRVVCGAPSKLVVVSPATLPGAAVATDSFQFTIGVADVLGNVLTDGTVGDAGDVCRGAQCREVAATLREGVSSLTGDTVVQVGQSQQAVFSDLGYPAVGTIQLRFSTPMLGYVDAVVVVSAGEPSVLIAEPRSTRVEAGSAVVISVRACDRQGNAAAWTAAAWTSSDRITAAYLEGSSSAAVSQFQPSSITNGLATVSVTVTAASTFELQYTGLYRGAQLNATRTGRISVVAAAASSVVALSSPSSAQASGDVAVGPTELELRDAHGNLVQRSDVTVSVAVTGDAAFSAPGAANNLQPYSFWGRDGAVVPTTTFVGGKATFNAPSAHPSHRYRAPHPVAAVVTVSGLTAASRTAGAAVSQSSTGASGVLRADTSTGTASVLQSSEAAFDTSGAVTISGAAAGTPSSVSATTGSLSLAAVAVVPESAAAPSGCECWSQWEYPDGDGGTALHSGCARTADSAGRQTATLTGLSATARRAGDVVSQQSTSASGVVAAASTGSTVKVTVTSTALFDTSGAVVIAGAASGTPSAVASTPADYWCYVTGPCTGAVAAAEPAAPEPRMWVACSVTPSVVLQAALNSLAVQETQTVITPPLVGGTVGQAVSVAFELRTSAGTVITTASPAGATATLTVGGTPAQGSCTVSAGKGMCSVTPAAVGIGRVRVVVPGAYPDAYSGDVDILPAAAASLTVTSYPSGGVVVNTNFLCTVQARDSAGNPTWIGADEIAVVGSKEGSLHGRLLRPVLRPGSVTFTGLSYDTVGSTVLTVRANLSSGAALAAQSGAFDVTAGPASRVRFLSVPASATVGESFDLIVGIEDTNGLATTPPAPVQISVSSSGVGALSGALSASANTASTFRVSYDRAGTLRLRARGPAGWEQDAAAMTINYGPPAGVRFVRLPGNATSGVPFRVVTQLVDAAGSAIPCPTACTGSVRIQGRPDIGSDPATHAGWRSSSVPAGHNGKFTFADVFANEEAAPRAVSVVAEVFFASSQPAAKSAAAVLVTAPPPPPAPTPKPCNALRSCSGHGVCAAGSIVGCDCYAQDGLGFFGGKDCSRCAGGYYPYPACDRKRCPVDASGKECSGRGVCSAAGVCQCFGSASASDLLSGEVPAGGGLSQRAAYVASGYGAYGHWCGDDCGSCCDGYRCGSCKCKDCTSDADCSGHGSCQSDGSCECASGYTGTSCGLCDGVPTNTSGGAVTSVDGSCQVNPPRCDCSRPWPLGRRYFSATHPKPQIDCRGYSAPPPVAVPVDHCGCPMALPYECKPGTNGSKVMCPGEGCPATCQKDAAGAVVCPALRPATVDCRGFCVQWIAPEGTDQCGCPLVPAPVCAPGTDGGARCQVSRCTTDVPDETPGYLSCASALVLPELTMTDRRVTKEQRLAAARAATTRRPIHYAFRAAPTMDFDGCTGVQVRTCTPRGAAPRRCDGQCPFWTDLVQPAGVLRDPLTDGIEIDCGGWPKPVLEPAFDPCGCPFPKLVCRNGTEGTCGQCPRWGPAPVVDCRGGPPPRVKMLAPHPCGCPPPPAPECSPGTGQSCLCAAPADPVRVVYIDCAGRPLPSLRWENEWLAEWKTVAVPSDRCPECRVVQQVACLKNTTQPAVPLKCPSPPCRNCPEPTNCPDLAEPQAVDCGGNPAPERVPFDEYCDCPTPQPNTCICGTDGTGWGGCGGCYLDPDSCSPFVCGDVRSDRLQPGDTCRTSCDSDEHCTEGNVCIKGGCVAPGPELRGCNKNPKSCYPYTCEEATGVCRSQCTTHQDCAVGQECSLPVVVSEGAGAAFDVLGSIVGVAQEEAPAAGVCGDPPNPDQCTGHDSCFPYACGVSNEQRVFVASSCRHSCSTDDHCHTAARCDVAAGLCSEGSSEKPSSCAGRSYEYCGAYACGDHVALNPAPGATCRTDCTVDGHCAILYRCDGPSRTCVKGPLVVTGQDPDSIPDACYESGDRTRSPTKCLVVPVGGVSVFVPPLAAPAPVPGLPNAICNEDPLMCSPYVCGNTPGTPARNLPPNSTCVATCTVSDECVAGNVCYQHKCRRLRRIGASCASAVQCASGFCVDGICCSTSCDDDCRTCVHMGTCAWVRPKSDPRGDCGKCRWCAAPAGAAYGESRECGDADFGTDINGHCGAHGVCNGNGGCVCDNSPETGFWAGLTCQRCKNGYRGSECKEAPVPTCPSTDSSGQSVRKPDTRPIQWAKRVLEVSSENRPGSSVELVGLPDAGTPYRSHVYSTRSWAPVQPYCTAAADKRCYELPVSGDDNTTSPPGECSNLTTCQYFVVEFPTAVYITGIKIMESFNPGSVVAVWAQPAASGAEALGLPVAVIEDSVQRYVAPARSSDELVTPAPRYGWPLATNKGRNGPTSINTNGREFVRMWSRSDPAFHSQPRYTEFVVSRGEGGGGCSGTVSLDTVPNFRSKVVKVELEATGNGLSQIDAIGILGFTRVGQIECPGRVEQAVRADGCSQASSSAAVCRSTATEVKYCSGHGECTPSGCQCDGYFSGSVCSDCLFGYTGENCEVAPEDTRAAPTPAPAPAPAPAPSPSPASTGSSTCCAEAKQAAADARSTAARAAAAAADNKCTLVAFEDLTQYTVTELGRQWLLREFITGEWDECDGEAFPNVETMYDIVGGPDYSGQSVNIRENGLYDSGYRSPVVPYKHFARKMESPPYNLGKHTHIRIAAGVLITDLPKDPNTGIIVRTAKYQTGRSPCGWKPSGDGEDLRRSDDELQASGERLVYVKHAPFNTGVNIIGRGKGDSMEALDVTIQWDPDNVSVSFQIWSPSIYHRDHRFTLTSFALYSCNYPDVSNSRPKAGDATCETDCRARAAAADPAKKGECAVEFRTTADGAGIVKDGGSPAVWQYGDAKDQLWGADPGVRGGSSRGGALTEI